MNSLWFAPLNSVAYSDSCICIYSARAHGTTPARERILDMADRIWHGTNVWHSACRAADSAAYIEKTTTKDERVDRTDILIP